MGKRLWFGTLVVALVLALAGCGAGGNNANGDLSLSFAMMVKDQAAMCGQPYTGLGSGSTGIAFNDLRFYVSNVRLINAKGEAVPLELTQDGAWQYRNVALLDFEDGTGGCSEAGTKQMNSVIKGKVPAGRYSAVTFDLGVPFELNHADVANAPSPLNVQSMWWSWQGGYKFVRVDMKTDTPAAGGAPGMGGAASAAPSAAMAPPSASARPSGMAMPAGAATPATAAGGDQGGGGAMLNPTVWLIHLGSTDCASADGAKAPSAECGKPNRPTIRLDNFTPGTSTIVADLGTLLAKVPLNQNTLMPPGCMSGADDPDCKPLFPGFGLDLGAGSCPDGNCGGQQFFRLAQEKK